MEEIVGKDLTRFCAKGLLPAAVQELVKNC